MRLLSRRRSISLERALGRGCAPRSKTIRPAEPYLFAGAEEARRLGHGYVGTEHLLLVLLHKPGGPAAALLARLGVETAALEEALQPCLGGGKPKIDPVALAAIGIDFDNVREHVERVFGERALERSHASCLGVAPRAKLALAHALDYAGDEPLRDEHILLGMLSVPDSLAARALSDLGVTRQSAEVALGSES
jgi:ATP-dependent Clp protease ATP-binding subunit ClpA